MKSFNFTEAILHRNTFFYMMHDVSDIAEYFNKKVNFDNLAWDIGNKVYSHLVRNV